MKLIELTGYGSYGTKVCVMVDRILHFREVSFNGDMGTEITMDNGNVIRVSQRVSEISDMIGQENK